MMGGESFILLKAGVLGPASAKQAEKRKAVFPTILSIARLSSGKPPRGGWKYLSWLYCRRFPLDMANSANSAGSPILLSRSQF
jgi:hypothetical protein